MSHLKARRITRSAAVAAFAVSISVSAPALAQSQHLGDRVLRQGMSGHDVRVLQGDLTRAGFATPVSGAFGAATERNVRGFERKYRLKVDGIVTPALVRALRVIATSHVSSGTEAHVSSAGSPAPSGGAVLGGSSSAKSTAKTTTSVVKSSTSQPTGDSKHLGDRVIRQGMSGHDVRVLQDYLTIAGYFTIVDGQFGPATKQSVIAFQRAHHLTPNGVVSLDVAHTLRVAVAAEIAAQKAAPVGRARVNSNGTATAPSNAPAVVKAVIAAGNRIATKPYIYGGGHGSWNDSGYDCSGSVSYALHGGNLLSSPEDSGELESYGSPGPGRWITIWANAGHTYMYVAGLRFDTSAQGETGGSRWTSQARSNAGFVERHPGRL